MFSEVNKQQPRDDDFLGDTPQCSNQNDVSLTSVSDLETHVKSKGNVRRISSGYLLINVLDFSYIYYYILYINYE